MGGRVLDRWPVAVQERGHVCAPARVSQCTSALPKLEAAQPQLGQHCAKRPFALCVPIRVRVSACICVFARVPAPAPPQAWKNTSEVTSAGLRGEIMRLTTGLEEVGACTLCVCMCVCVLCVHARACVHAADHGAPAPGGGAGAHAVCLCVCTPLPLQTRTTLANKASTSDVDARLRDKVGGSWHAP